MTRAANMHVTSSSYVHRYYCKGLPPVDNAPGDVWMRLPSLGSSGESTGTGIVITPACDLANDKTDVLTFLPVMTVTKYLSGRAAYSLLRPVVIELLTAVGLSEYAIYFPRGKITSTSDLNSVYSEVRSASVKKEKTGQHARAVAGIDAIRSIHLSTDNRALMSACLGEAKLREIYARVVRNSYAEDIHFLPPDEAQKSWSAIPEPSVVLFRYPTARSIDLLADANDIGENESVPIKTTRLHREFLSDLLTRFTRLYVRLGSADFSEDAVEKMIEKIKDAP